MLNVVDYFYLVCVVHVHGNKYFSNNEECVKKLLKETESSWCSTAILQIRYTQTILTESFDFIYTFN